MRNKRGKCVWELPDHSETRPKVTERGGARRSTSAVPRLPMAHGPKQPQKADAVAPVLLGGTVALPVPPQPPARAAQARALAKEWGPTLQQKKRRGARCEVANLARVKAQPRLILLAASHTGRVSPKVRCQ